MLELKYLHKKDGSKPAVEGKLLEAKDEIEKYRDGSVLREKVDTHPLDCYAIVFVGSECRVCQKI